MDNNLYIDYLNSLHNYNAQMKMHMVKEILIIHILKTLWLE